MKRIPPEDRAGLYITIIVHLAVLIVALIAGLGWSLQQESSFVLDFTKQDEIEKMQEEIERLQKEAAFKEEVSRRLQEKLKNSGVSAIRNVAVDRGALKDDRGTDAEQLYKDAQRLQQELDGGFKAPEDILSDKPELKKPVEQKQEAVKYSGPSVVSYTLEGRKASKLPIPAYRCMGAGEVTVLIKVNNSGTVTAAKVDESVSSKDGCLRAFAIRAARLSKFSASPTAPASQDGNIVYSFIAQ